MITFVNPTNIRYIIVNATLSERPVSILGSVKEN